MGRNTYYRFVLLFEGRHRRRAEDGAAVREKAGDAALSSHRIGERGQPRPSVDAAPATRPRKPDPGGPSQPSAGITTGRLQWLHESKTKERWPPLRMRSVLRTRSCPEARPKGTQTAASGAPEGASLPRKGGDAFAKRPTGWLRRPSIG